MTRLPIGVTALVLAFAVSPRAAGVPAAAGDEPLYSATEAIERAVSQRMGPHATITITALDRESGSALYREARPDPTARLGRAIRFTLVTASGTTVGATASLEVVTSYVVARQHIGRGHIVGAGQVEAVRGALTGAPLSPVAEMADVVGVRTLRPIGPGTVVLPAFVARRRSIERGQTITVRALAGPVEVTAAFVAIDAGDVGDIIRVRNPDTKKYQRGRIVEPGLVEVIYER